MKVIKIISAIFILIFILSFIPFLELDGPKFEKNSLDLESCALSGAKMSNWNGQNFYTNNEPDHKYLDELRNKFISFGFSEDYFNENIKLIYADIKENQITAWFTLTTNSWLDKYNANFGYAIPMCDVAEASNCDICKQYITKIKGFVDLSNKDDVDPVIVYVLNDGEAWQNNKLMNNPSGLDFPGINNVLSPWKAGLIAKVCAPISLNMYRVSSDKGLKFEYIIKGENFKTIFEKNKQIEARVDLITGEVECSEESTIFY